MNTLESLAQVVKSNFKQLTESEIVGRIMILSGRNMERSLKGYRMMREKGLLEGFVEPQTDGAFERLVTKYPNIVELIDEVDAIPGKIEIREFVLEPIIAVDVKRLLERLNTDPIQRNSSPQEPRTTPINDHRHIEW